jgi:hypothetical protein
MIDNFLTLFQVYFLLMIDAYNKGIYMQRNVTKYTQRFTDLGKLNLLMVVQF